MNEHEAMVRQFFRDCKQEDPKLYREVCARHMVLSTDQMTHRNRKEIPISQLKGDVFRELMHELFYSGDRVHPEEMGS